jgi:uncharacterized damage-inducible protein DinB
MNYPRIDIVPHWESVQRDLLAVIDLIPDDRMDWSPKPELWNFRGILLHVVSARDYWMGKIVGDGDRAPSVYETAHSPGDIKRECARAWERLGRFLSDPARLDREYEEDAVVSGHWIAFHVLEHDIHHRADLLHYLALLDIATPEIGTP